VAVRDEHDTLPTPPVRGLRHRCCPPRQSLARDRTFVARAIIAGASVPGQPRLDGFA